MGLGLKYHKLGLSCLIHFQRHLDSAHLLSCFCSYIWVKNRCKEMQRCRNPKGNNRSFPDLFSLICIYNEKLGCRIWIGILSKANSLKWFWMKDKIYHHLYFCSSICPCHQLNLFLNLCSFSNFTFQICPKKHSSASFIYLFIHSLSQGGWSKKGQKRPPSSSSSGREEIVLSHRLFLFF